MTIEKRKIRPSNGWAERAKLILQREQERPMRPAVDETAEAEMDYGREALPYEGCTCVCHKDCHTCGQAFVEGVPHINCADTVGGTSNVTSWENEGGAYGFTS